MMTPEQVEQIVIGVLIGHEPTRDPDGALREVERALEKSTELRDTMKVKLLVDDLVRRGGVHRESIPTDSFSSDDQRWCWKIGPV
jgi:hypothetical protein